MEYISAKTPCLHFILDCGGIDHRGYTFCNNAENGCTDTTKTICQNTQRNTALYTQAWFTSASFFIKHICLEWELAVTVCNFVFHRATIFRCKFPTQNSQNKIRWVFAKRFRCTTVQTLQISFYNTW